MISCARQQLITAARLVLLRADIESVLGDIVIGREKAAFVSDAQSGNRVGVLGSVRHYSRVSIGV